MTAEDVGADLQYAHERIDELERLTKWWSDLRAKAIAAGAVDPRPCSGIACGGCGVVLEIAGAGFRSHQCARP